MEHRPVLGDVEVLTAEHRVDPFAQSGGLRQRDEQVDRLRGDPVLRVVQVEVAELHGQLGAARGMLGEQVAKVEIADLLVVLAQCLPLRRANRADHYFIDSSSTIFSAWPPNCLRMADCSLFEYAALPWEAKRVYSAAVST